MDDRQPAGAHADSERVTQLLARIGYDADARDRVFQALYADLHGIAHSLMRGQRKGHSLGTTGLVHEAYLKLIRLDPDNWEGRRHFCCVAARAMRSVLVDHARARGRQKRMPPEKGLLDEVLRRCETRVEDVLELDRALEGLAEKDERQARVVELRFLAGCTTEEVAGILDVSSRTVERDWKEARAWLKTALAKR